MILDYVSALEKEIKTVGTRLDQEIIVHTVYFGGGTPSLLSPMNFERILSALNDVFSLTKDIEISLEANPGTLSFPYLQDLHSLGLNRISLGMQSTQPEELRLLGRQHTYIEVIKAVKWARQASFENLSLDMIFGTPGQTISNWLHSLGLAIDLDPDHFSLYSLTIEPGTPMFSWYSRGLIPEEDTDLAAEMYELAGERLNIAGYIQYEISNWARYGNGKKGFYDPDRIDGKQKKNSSRVNIPHPAYACQHNLQYWRNLPYLGFGAGAHGFSSGFRTVNVLSPQTYTQRILSNNDKEDYPFPRSPANSDLIPIDRITEMRESMMMGLRLTLEGVSKYQFQDRFGVPLNVQFPDEIRNNVNWGLLEWVGECLRLTPKGRLLGNRVFAEFV